VTAPSGGLLYPIDTYVYARRVTRVPRGLYLYDPSYHMLVAVDTPVDRCEAMSHHSAHRATIDGAAAVFLLAAAFERSQAKYLERSYRVVLLEARHIQ
jgi:SagB-type dehydrogenase family enzyme